MKKAKAVSMLLIASVLMSMTGCSGAKKQVIAAADEYAKAILEADAGDIADLVDDGDEEVLESFFDMYSSNEDLQEVYDFILENASYEIDKKSVEVKDKKASAVIVFTMVDYMDVYDDLDDDAEAEDYLEALEDAADSTCEVELKVSFKLVKDEWKIVDDDHEDLQEFYEFYPEIYDLGWGVAGEITIEAFQAACEDILGDHDYYIFDSEFSSIVSSSSTEVFTELIWYSEAGSSATIYENAHNAMQDAVDDGVCDGEFTAYDDGTTAYMLFDGYSDSQDFLYGDIYGGVFCTENAYMIVYCSAGDASSEELTDEFLEAMGYPTP